MLPPSTPRTSLLSSRWSWPMAQEAARMAVSRVVTLALCSSKPATWMPCLVMVTVPVSLVRRGSVLSICRSRVVSGLASSAAPSATAPCRAAGRRPSGARSAHRFDDAVDAFVYAAPELLVGLVPFVVVDDLGTQAVGVRAGEG